VRRVQNGRGNVRGGNVGPVLGASRSKSGSVHASRDVVVVVLFYLSLAGDHGQ